MNGADDAERIPRNLRDGFRFYSARFNTEDSLSGRAVDGAIGIGTKNVPGFEGERAIAFGERGGLHDAAFGGIDQAETRRGGLTIVVSDEPWVASAEGVDQAVDRWDQRTHIYEVRIVEVADVGGFVVFRIPERVTAAIHFCNDARDGFTVEADENLLELGDP